MVCNNSSIQHNTLPALAVVACSTGTMTSAGRVSSFQHKSQQQPLPTLEAYCSPPLPLELDNSSESLTHKLDNILANPSKRDLSILTYDERRTLLDWEEQEGLGVGACLNIFPSGEITGGCYSKGNKHAPGQKGRVISTEFTRQARKKIRLVVDCKITNFKLFLTLTFDPKISQLTKSGIVDQTWAKDRFKQFLNTIKKKYDRLADKTENDNFRLSYIWVAEVQGNANIHFHILLDRSFIEIKWLVKLWGQSSNSVNIKRLNDQQHAANYMLKYMKKGNCPIEGKRYGMTHNLIEGSKPRKFDFYGRSKRNVFLRIKDSLEWQIKQNGGYVADWGLSIPAPRRVRIWRGKDGRKHELPGTSRKIGDDFMAKIEEAMAGIDLLLSYDNKPCPYDLPF